LTKVALAPIALLLVSTALSQRAHAATRVIDGEALKLRATADNGVILIFRSEDPSAAFPAMGGPSDPAAHSVSGTPGKTLASS
jgi:hypothetical protein